MKADIELVNEVKAGNKLAFSELILRHQQSLLRTILRLCKEQSMAEDVIQESFVKAFQKLNQFEGRSSFKSWLFRIAINTAKNKLRTIKYDQVSMEYVHLSKEAEAERALVREATEKRIKMEVDKLPKKQRVALILRVYEDMSFKEIAQMMDCPYDTAKANYRHALMKIKAALNGDDLLKTWLEFAETDEIRESANLSKYEH